MNDKISSIKIDGVGYEIQDLEAKTRIDEIENSYVKATDTVEEVTSIEENLVTNALRKTAQTLTAAEKSQVQENIGVDGLKSDINNEVYRAIEAEAKLRAETAELKELESKVNVSFIASSNADYSDAILPNIDTVNKVLDLGEDAIICIGKKSYGKHEFALDFNPRAIPFYVEGEPTSAVKLVFNVDSRKLYCIPSSNTLTSVEALIGGFRLIYQTHEFVSASLPFEYTVDGKSLEDKMEDNVEALKSEMNVSLISSNYTNGYAELPNIDTVNKVLDLGSDAVICVGNKSYGKNEFPADFNSRAIPFYVENNDTGAIRLVFNTKSRKLYCVPGKNTLSENEVLVGAFRLTYKSHNFISANLPFEYTIDGKSLSAEVEALVDKVEALVDNVPVNMFSTKGVVNKVKAAKVGTLSTGTYIQGCDIYENFLFQGQDGGVINIFDRSKGYEHIGGYQSAVNLHMTNLSFGNEKYAESDEFPLLYIPQNASQGYKVYVLRVTRNSSELVQTISFPKDASVIGYYPVSIVDRYNGYIYCWCYKKNSYTDSIDNTFVITKYKLPTLSDGNITLQLLERFEVPFRGTGQGACCDGVNLYFQCGFGQSPTYLQIISLYNKCEIGLWNISEFTTSEPEGICVNENKLIFTHINRDVNEVEFGNYSI